jgi:hypothetical protein
MASAVTKQAFLQAKQNNWIKKSATLGIDSD